MWRSDIIYDLLVTSFPPLLYHLSLVGRAHYERVERETGVIAWAPIIRSRDFPRVFRRGGANATRRGRVDGWLFTFSFIHLHTDLLTDSRVARSTSSLPQVVRVREDEEPYLLVSSSSTLARTVVFNMVYPKSQHEMPLLKCS